jgi:hypothetical protein
LQERWRSGEEKELDEARYGRKEGQIMEEHVKEAWKRFKEISLDQLRDTRLVYSSRMYPYPNYIESVKNAERHWEDIHKIALSAVFGVAGYHAGLTPRQLEKVLEEVLAKPREHFKVIRSARGLSGAARAHLAEVIDKPLPPEEKAVFTAKRLYESMVQNAPQGKRNRLISFARALKEIAEKVEG